MHDFQTGLLLSRHKINNDRLRRIFCLEDSGKKNKICGEIFYSASIFKKKFNHHLVVVSRGGYYLEIRSDRPIGYSFKVNKIGKNSG